MTEEMKNARLTTSESEKFISEGFQILDKKGKNKGKNNIMKSDNNFNDAIYVYIKTGNNIKIRPGNRDLVNI
jgi:hypothetical protein